MAKVRQVLKHVSVETALRKRICHRDRRGHEIAKGTQCLVIKDESSSSSRNYCPGCAEPILDKAQEHLDQLKARLEL